MIGQKHIFFISLLAASSISVPLNSYAFGVKECLNTAETALEEVYCEIIIKGKGNTLPDFFNFRRNTEKTQRLLLKRGAARAGISLPKDNGEVHQAYLPPQPEITQGKEQSREAQTPAEQPSPRNATAVLPKTTNARPQNTLESCSLAKEKIICNNQRYFLAINIPANRLQQNALSSLNRLALPSKQQQQSTLQYLSNIYPRYIEKMLSIGLGDSTVSFTKFYAIYDTSIEQKEDFSQRFEEMFELLKKERKTMAIKQRYRNNFPQSMESCMQLSNTLIACDNIEQNWVYKKIKNF